MISTVEYNLGELMHESRMIYFTNQSLGPFGFRAFSVHGLSYDVIPSLSPPWFRNPIGSGPRPRPSKIHRCSA